MRASAYPMVDAAEAAALVLDRTPVLPSEVVPIAEAAGRVLAEDLLAPADLPPFPSSAVDGYALRSEDGGGRLRVVGESAAGRPYSDELPPGAACRILTGAVLPPGADTVVMVEDVDVEAGADVELLPVAPDELDPLRALVEDALARCDVLVTSGGVSVGSHDLVKPLLERLGEVHVGRVRLKPGKPFTFATLGEGKLAFGLPGFPVSSLVTFEVFVRPALRKLQGHRRLQRPVLPVRLGHASRPGGDPTEYQRVTLHREGDDLVAEGTGSQSSSRLLSLTGAHALIRIPPEAEPQPAGALVDAIVLDLP